MQNGLVKIYTLICDTLELSSSRHSADRLQVGTWQSICCCAAGGVARGLVLLVLVLVPIVLFMLRLLLLQLRKARVVTVSSTYHSRTVCERAVCTYAGRYTRVPSIAVGK